MNTGSPPDVPSDHQSCVRPQDTVVNLHDAKRALLATANGHGVARDPGEIDPPSVDPGSGPKAQIVTGLAVASNSSQEAWIGEPTASGIIASALPSPPIASDRERSSLVRRRINAAARPILEAYARSHGQPSKRLQTAIEGPAPLAHPAIARELGGALHSEAMRDAIAANADPGLVPLKVRADLAKMSAQDLTAPLPSAAAEVFPDRDKPLAPARQHYLAWHASNAAAWLKPFPPTRHLPQPLDTWDDATAAPWLNDRASMVADSPKGDEDGVVVAIDASNPWKPPLEVLHTLDEIELEELAYRVFVERLRREVMPFHVSERRVCVRNAILHVTFGYRTLKDARRRVREHDLKRVRYFDRLFGANREWIFDLCCRIVAAYTWPVGFTESELWFEFPDLE